ncbi:ABC transporter C family member 5-like isoform X2 [Rhododendron vialii]|uniref:ABC transporter C family member 5-like isoform X2 n=1 Tax=Rhododendron vialii TaxID=182163 RepID=UPI00265E4692|nr:ABC transporter C family member 5-like isoform X2 [Rhododendron vialii]
MILAGTDFKALVSTHHEAIESMDIPNNSSEDSNGSNPRDASIAFSKRCDFIGNNGEVKEGLSAHKLAAIKTAWLPSVLLADAYPLQFAYVCTQQMSFNQVFTQHFQAFFHNEPINEIVFCMNDFTWKVPR